MRATQAVRLLRWTMLSVAGVFFALHFLHLTADFPNGSPWNDWSKYTDEGWYGDGAMRHFLLGHWYLAGDFNPAVVMPVWPALETIVFRFTGVSLAAARALTVVLFGVTVLALYALIERYEGLRPGLRGSSLAAPLVALLLCTSSFLFVFDRLAILEPPLAMFSVLALLAASYARPWAEREPRARGWIRVAAPQLAVGLLVLAMVLTKPTAVALIPAVAFLLCRRADASLRGALWLMLPPLLFAGVLWLAYYALLVRPHYLEDYEYLFAANAYTGFQLEPLSRVLFNTVADGRWMGAALYVVFFLALVTVGFRRLAFFRNPLVPALLLWTAGYLFFLAYHNNLQPRYYLLLAIPVTALTAMALSELAQGRSAGLRGSLLLRSVVVAACVLAIALPDAMQQIDFVRHPEYSYEAAAQAIARIVRSDKAQAPLILSVSGSDLTLMTGLPSIDDDFGTLDLNQRVEQYRPGWYVAWNEIDDDKMNALQPLYRPVRVAEFPVMDDPDRNLLILYRLQPATAPGASRRATRRIPRPLRTRLGEQPPTEQLQH